MSGATPGAGDVTKGIPPQELATSTGTVPRDPSDVPPPPRGNVILKEILRGSAVTTILAIVLALIVGGILIALTNEDVQAASVYFFAQPGDTFVAAWNAVYNGYEALFRGAIFNARGADFAAQIRPLTNTLGFAAPLIAAGLGVALAFRVGLFNIGARGQMLIGVAVAALLTFSLDLPIWLHIPVTLIAGIAGGALWGAIAGLIKARTGAHEVILTIMLNYIAYYLLSAQFPTLLGPQFPLLDLGFVIVIVATLFVWWLIERSSLGMRMRAVGENPHAARAAGISVQRIYVYAMLFAGGLAGLAGMNQIQGAVTTGVTETIDAGIGFDAITVALLGRSRAWGTFAAGILFGALKAGSFSMQAQNIPVDIVLVVQSLVVLFIAAPPLLRTVFFLPKTDIEKAARLRAKAAKKAVAA